MNLAHQDTPSSTRQSLNIVRSSRSRGSNGVGSNNTELDKEIFQPALGQNSPAPQVLSKIVVPARSRSSMDSSLSSVRDQSSGYDTPATSAAMTPAESSNRDETRYQRSAKLVQDSVSHMTSKTSFVGKRKRAYESDLIEADLRLAQALQEREYEHQPNRSSFKRGKRVRVEDTDDEEPFSSSLPKPVSTAATYRSKSARSTAGTVSQPRTYYEEDSEEIIDSSVIAEASKNRTNNLTRRTPLPSRAARDSANRSLEDANIHLAIDSDYSSFSDHLSDVSAFASDLDLEAVGTSEESGVEGPIRAINSRGDVTTVSAPSAPGATAPRQRRRAYAPRGANTSQNRRRMRGVEDRVG